MAKELTPDNFDEAVLQADGPVMVDFWAPWCGPCKRMAPIVEELSTEMDGITIAKVNVDDHQELAKKYNIMSIPTFVVFKNGETADQFAGLMDKEDLKKRLEAQID